MALTLNLRAWFVEPFLPASATERKRRWKRMSVFVVAAALIWVVGWCVVRLNVALEPETQQAYWYGDEPTGTCDLAIVVHGWTKGPADMEEIASVLRECDPNLAIRMWSYDASRFSNANPEGLAQDLEREIAELHSRARGRVILVGHSLGGLLLRRSYLTGLARDENGWAAQVDRIVLLAAPNRGTKAISRSLYLAAADALSRSYRVGELIRATYRGAPFIVNLRLDWIREIPKLERPPLVAQIVGNRDDVVSSADSLDGLQFRSAMLRELPNSTHASVVHKRESGAYIKEVLAAPLTTSAPVDDARGAERSKVFKALIVHGIRDYGDRFDQLRDAVSGVASSLGYQPLARAPRYQYFSALQFVNPLSRRAKVYEFADLYADLLATPPVDAPIHFAGHSFGTYLLGRSLRDYPAMRFEKAYFAGSVLHESFFSSTGDGAGALGRQIGWLRNDIATEDWPVGILCSGLDKLNLAEFVGTGGFNGFTGIVEEDRHCENRYFPGGHGKALERENQASIAAWLVQPSAAGSRGVQGDPALASLLVSTRSACWDLASRLAPLLFVLVVGAAVYLLFFGRRPWISLAAIMALLWFLNIA
ncbi:MAG: alpha/beta fold hydrolase [Planctomycetes bacterium]|nr:alpha/beta fold hydrolase [Planctomycetota bacterium]